MSASLVFPGSAPCGPDGILHAGEAGSGRAVSDIAPPNSPHVTRPMQERLQNINVLSSELLPTPKEIKRAMLLPAASEKLASVFRSRGAVRRILDREDPRLFVVIGPCSIHDPNAAREYATRLPGLAGRVDRMLVIMRVYFEKPRTTVGWKGLINDPARRLLPHRQGPRAGARLLLSSPTWGCPPPPRRSTRSRRSTSPSSCLDGDRRAHHRVADPPRDGERPLDARRVQERHRRLVAAAINALLSARHPHISSASRSRAAAVFQTRGNPYGHIVLRGGGGRSNYAPASMAAASASSSRRGSRRGSWSTAAMATRQGPPPAVAVARRRDQIRGATGRSWADAREQHPPRQPADPGRPGEAGVRRVGDRRLHRLGDHRGTAAVARWARLRTAPRFARDPAAA